MTKKLLIVSVILIFSATTVIAGGWSKDKGLSKMTVNGKLVCLGCSLKKLDGANAQCNLYSHHAIGFKTADGALWSIVDNAKGHDIIMGHKLLEKKDATITGWLYPSAHFIEIDKIKVSDVSKKEIQVAGLAEDKLLGESLIKRKLGEVPVIAKTH